MDKFKIDSHKLMYHVSRVKSWQDGELIYPIYMEISPIGACNHRCVFCGLDFMGYKLRKISHEVMGKILPEMAGLGLKSIMYAGEGEPFLHQDIGRIIRLTKQQGIDVAVTSNGALMNPDLAEEILPFCSWIKFSVNAGTPDTYARIHGTRARDFDKVIKNLSHAAFYRKKHDVRCTLGIQILLLTEVEDEIETLVALAREIGMDYLVVKPYSQHPQSITRKYQDISYKKYYDLGKTLEKYNTDRFSVIVRLNTMQQWDAAGKGYDRCLGLPFWSYIDAGGNVWGCSMYLNDDRFLYGNINEDTFQNIWEGDRRKKSLELAENSLSVDTCRVNCRMDNINRYLWELKNPNDHVKFI